MDRRRSSFVFGPALALALALAFLAVGLHPGRRAEAQATPPAFVLDMVPDVTPCSSLATADLTRAPLAIGGSFSVDGCWFGGQATAGRQVGVISTDIIYNDAVIKAPEVANVAPALNDNPDFDQLTLSGSSAGTGWDCSGLGAAFPTGDKNAGAPGPGLGDAFIGCFSLLGPFTFDTGNSGRLFSITFDAVAGGTTTLHTSNFALSDSAPLEIASCNPVQITAADCPDSSVDVAGPTPTPTNTPTNTAVPVVGTASPVGLDTVTPTPTATPQVTNTPVPEATQAPTGGTGVQPPPAGGLQGEIRPPSTGSGPDSGSALPAGLFALLAAGGVLSAAGTIAAIRRRAGR